mmetsp:Transcript_30260/g.63352  ORF Transcript_30260/g.63352 Transcript_30260/m.63352 type:complete len:385 (+) Transcript_30260:1-1155(+)
MTLPRETSFIARYASFVLSFLLAIGTTAAFNGNNKNNAAPLTALTVGTDVFRLRPFSFMRDQTNLVEICKDVYGGDDYLPTTARAYEEEADCNFFVLEDETTGELVGAANLRRLDKAEKSYWVEAIRVSPEFEGRGVATILTRELCRRAREEGARQIMSCTSTGNVSMMKIFPKTGIDMEPVSKFRFPNFRKYSKLPGWSLSEQGKDYDNGPKAENILKALDLEHLVGDESRNRIWDPIESRVELNSVLRTAIPFGRSGHLPAIGTMRILNEELEESIQRGLVRSLRRRKKDDPPAIFALVKRENREGLRSRYMCSIVATTSEDFDTALWEACKAEYVPSLRGNPAFALMFELLDSPHPDSLLGSGSLPVGDTDLLFYRWVESI